MSRIKIACTIKYSNRRGHDFCNITGSGWTTILYPLSWTTCGVAKMLGIFQSVDLSQCHTTVITVRTYGCSAKVTEFYNIRLYVCIFLMATDILISWFVGPQTATVCWEGRAALTKSRLLINFSFQLLWSNHSELSYIELFWSVKS